MQLQNPKNKKFTSLPLYHNFNLPVPYFAIPKTTQQLSFSIKKTTLPRFASSSTSPFRNRTTEEVSNQATKQARKQGTEELERSGMRQGIVAAVTTTTVYGEIVLLRFNFCLFVCFFPFFSSFNFGF